MYSKLFDGIVTLLDQIDLKEESKLMGRLAEECDKNREILSEIYNNTNINSINCIIVGIREEGRISEKRINKIKQLRDTCQKRVKDKINIDISRFKVNDEFEYNIKAMDRFGIFTLDKKDGSISLFIHPKFTVINFSYLINYNKKSCIKHIETIADIKDISNFDSKVVYNTVIEKLKNKISNSLENQSKLENYISRISKNNDKFEIEFLPTSTDFYNAGIKYYQSSSIYERTPFSIFSTTSGLFLPEEHYGSEFFIDILNRPDLAKKYDKNKYRKRYFEALKNSTPLKRRYYFFESHRSKKQFNKILNNLTEEEKTIYNDKAMNILNTYLNKRNFELIKVKRFPKCFDYLTLGNSLNLMISNRHGKGKIGHGFWIRPMNKNMFKHIIKELCIDSLIKNSYDMFTTFTLGNKKLEDFLGDFTNLSCIFVTPLIYILFNYSNMKIKQLRGLFNDLRKIMSDEEIDYEVIKYSTDTGPIKNINNITDLF